MKPLTRLPSQEDELYMGSDKVMETTMEKKQNWCEAQGWGEALMACLILIFGMWPTLLTLACGYEIEVSIKPRTIKK